MVGISATGLPSRCGDARRPTPAVFRNCSGRWHLRGRRFDARYVKAHRAKRKGVRRSHGGGRSPAIRPSTSLMAVAESMESSSTRVARRCPPSNPARAPGTRRRLRLADRRSRHVRVREPRGSPRLRRERVTGKVRSNPFQPVAGVPICRCTSTAATPSCATSGLAIRHDQLSIRGKVVDDTGAGVADARISLAESLDWEIRVEPQNPKTLILIFKRLVKIRKATFILFLN